ncbi:cyclin-dependent kinase G-2 [Arachis duranensis]|uniref:cyclin-dependent kinase n=1 Tax=Arachis duranensis TaxID=130453 RepID=A0A6P4CPD4_ARADU|nr:cyclin-dependent kinase G-2 [Arachis duranensis]XP_020993923.1 cyclin-dependent kinase G-2 [Arachis duranensis]
MAAGRGGVLKRGESYKYGSIKEFDCKYNNDGSSMVEASPASSSHGGEALLRAEKRRKVSPNAWDMGESEVRVSSKNRVTQVVGLPPTTPSPADSSFVLPGEQSGDGDTDADCFEGNKVQGWNIAMSRWASADFSPVDASYDEDKDGKVSLTTESGEILEGSSGGKVSRSTGSSERGKSDLSSDDDTDTEEDNIVDSIEEEDEEQGKTAYSLVSDSDENLGGCRKVERNINMLNSCRSVFEFEMIKKINEGTYGVVYKAKDKKTGEIVALKKVKMNIDKEGFPLTSLREMNILLSFNHPSIVDVKEVVVDDFDGVFMVMEYMEHDLKGLMDDMKQPFSIGEIKSLMWQLLQGVDYLHDNWVLHRDLKSSNILLNNKGELKICDFGLSRQYGSPLKPYTPLVVTLRYRAPELLLGSKEYSTAIDMWSVGCIMAELVAREPLFKGKNEVEQLDQIFRTLGTPDENIWPGLSKLPGSKAKFVRQPYNMLWKKFPVASFTGQPVLSESGFDLLSRLLTYDPEKRITAKDALLHDWFHEAPLSNSDFKPISPFRC